MQHATPTVYFNCLSPSLLQAIVVLASAAVNIYLSISNQREIEAISEYVTEVEVLRDGTVQKISSELLVPGDLIDITSNWTLPCDLAIVQGAAICDESGVSLEGAESTNPLIACRLETNRNIVRARPALSVRVSLRELDSSRESRAPCARPRFRRAKRAASTTLSAAGNATLFLLGRRSVDFLFLFLSFTLSCCVRLSLPIPSHPEGSPKRQL